MKTIIIMFVLGLSLGFLGCTQKVETIEDDQEIVIEDNAENVQEDEKNDKDEKHVEDPADILQDLTF